VATESISQPRYPVVHNTPPFLLSLKYARWSDWGQAGVRNDSYGVLLAFVCLGCLVGWLVGWLAAG
jgi:hypothetical protein